MNTTASYSSEHSWHAHSRRGSIESELSIQGKETDYVRDTSDTDCETDEPVEYEPCTEPEDEGPLSGDSSSQSDNEIIATKVIEVSVCDDGDLEFADSEQTESDGGGDSEMDLHDFWECAQCRAENNNPLYRYCEKCFKVRKNFFPPRPKRKHKRAPNDSDVPQSQAVDSGVESAFNSQDTQSSQYLDTQPADTDLAHTSQNTDTLSQIENKNDTITLPHRVRRKRRADSADRKNKRIKVDYSDSDSDSDSEPRLRKSKSADPPEVSKLVKTVSDPSLTIETDSSNLSKKAIINSLKENLESKDNMCIVCFSEPKSGVFVHGRIAHICCCYKCAVKVWAKAKRCPVCNCKVSNVLKAVVM